MPAAVRERGVLQLRRPGVRRADEQEQPRAVAAARGEEGVERVAAQVRAHGERVGERRVLPARLEERGGIRAARRAERGVGRYIPRPAFAPYYDAVKKQIELSVPKPVKR